jgi:hypothetical protein
MLHIHVIVTHTAQFQQLTAFFYNTKKILDVPFNACHHYGSVPCWKMEQAELLFF